MKEIILPPHLFDRIRASAGEHGGIGWGQLFDGGLNYGDPELTWSGVPLCAHGHAWGTCTRYNASSEIRSVNYNEPGLFQYLTWMENDNALFTANVASGCRIPFARWCELLNVKRGKDEDYVTVPAESDAEREAALA